MPDESRDADAEIIRAAYAERVKEAFVAFAESLTAGQAERACTDRFVRALGLAKKARDLALGAASGLAELPAPHQDTVAEEGTAGKGEAAAADALSASDQALIEHVLAGTTGGHGHR